MKNFARTALIYTFNKVWSLSEPLSYLKATKEKFQNEFEANIDFFLVQKFNDLPDPMKQTLFGKKDISRSDITFEWLNNVLMPAEFPNSVHRVNEALQGSNHNHYFSSQINKDYKREQVYTPSTVTIYNDEKHAAAATAVMNILLKGSHSNIIKDKIASYGAPVYLMRDNVKLEGHNALRTFERHLWDTTVPDDKKAELQAKVQQQVNARLPEGQTWEAFEGITAYSTLAGRPGVKMYNRVINNKGKEVDDKDDVKRIGLIPPQKLPSIVSNLPDVPGYSNDGRVLKNDSKFLKLYAKILGEERLEMFSNVFRSALGDKTFDLIFNGKLKAAGEIIKEEGIGTNRSLIANAKGLVSVWGYVEVGTVTVPLAVAFGASYGVLSVASDIANKITGKNLFEDVYRPYIEEKTGYSFTEATITKSWKPREIGEIGNYISSRQPNFGVETVQGKNNQGPDTTLKTSILVTPVFNHRTANLNKLEIDKFAADFVNKCKKSDKVKPLFDKIDDMEQLLHNFASAFADSVNASLIQEGTPASKNMYGKAWQNIFERSAHVTTPTYLTAEPEIRNLLKSTFIAHNAELLEGKNIKG